MAILAADNFNRANGIGLGANWTQPAGTSNQFDISSNAAIPHSAASGDSYDAYTAITWPNDQWSQANLTVSGTAGGGNGIGLAVRLATGQKTGYRTSLDHATSSNVDLSKVVNNTSTDLGLTSLASWTDGDLWELDILGTTLTLFHSGATQATTSDSAITSGNAGIFFSTSETSASLDNWAGGDFHAGMFGMSEPMQALADGAALR
jgi:hypothetical protein